MTQLEKMRRWLMDFPGLAGAELSTDCTQAQPDSAGLFPQGLEVLNEQRDILGNCTQKCRLTFTLRRRSLHKEEAAQWLLDLQEWVRHQSTQGRIPALGDEPEKETVRAQQGALQSASQTGTGLYAVKIIAEFYKKVRGE